VPAAKPLLDPLFEEYFLELEMPVSTARVAKSVLNRWHGFLAGRGKGLGDAVKVDVLAYRDSLTKAGLSDVTRISHLVALRRFYDWAVKAQHMKSDPAAHVEMRRPQETRPPALADEQLRKLMQSCPGTPVGRRDAAILLLLRHSGIRRSELCTVDLAHYGDHGGRASLMLPRTKNGQVRIVPVSDETRKLIGRYLRLVRGTEAGPLFVSRSSSDGRLTPNGVSGIVDRARIRAGITERIGVHSFRRAWTIDARSRGMSDHSIMRIAGWDDSEMIRRYTKTLEEKLAHDEYYLKMGAEKKPYRPRLRRVV
jgi:integrase/recombinase XerD